MSSKLAKQKAKLAELEAAAEALRTTVLEKEKVEQGVRVERAKHMSGAERQSSAEAMRKYFDLQNNGVVTEADVSAAATRLGVLLSPSHVRDLFQIFDADGDGVLSAEEFEVWWYNGFSSLHQAMRQQELIDQSEAQATTDPLPKWAPKGSLHGELTVGDIGDDFTPAASVLASVLPSNKAAYEDGLKTVLKEMFDEEEDEESDDPVKPNAESTPVFFQLYAGVRPGATEDEVEQCLEVLKAVLEEHSEQPDLPFGGQVKLETDAATGKQQFRFALYLRADRAGGEDEMEDGLKGSLGAGAAMLSQATNVIGDSATFSHVLAGLDIGVDPLRVLSLGSNTPIASLLSTLRLVVDAEYTERAIQLGSDALIAKAIESREWRHRRKGPALLRQLAFTGLLREVVLSVSVDSPAQSLEHALDKLREMPILAAKRYYPNMSPKWEAELRREADYLAASWKAAFQRMTPVEASMITVTAVRGIRKFVNTPKSIPRIVVASPDGVDRTEAVSVLNGGKKMVPEGPLSISVTSLGGKQVFLFDVQSAATAALGGLAPAMTVLVLDASSDDAIQKSVRYVGDATRVLVEAGTNHHTAQLVLLCPNGDATALEAAIKKVRALRFLNVLRQLPDGDEALRKLAFPNGTKDDAKAKTSARSDSEGSDYESCDDSADDDGGSEEGGGTELIKQVLSCVQKAIGSIDDVFAATPVGEAHVKLEGFNISNLLPASTTELALVRAQGQALFRGLTSQMDPSSRRSRHVLNLVERLLEEADDDSSDYDSSTDDDDANPVHPVEGVPMAWLSESDSDSDSFGWGSSDDDGQNRGKVPARKSGRKVTKNTKKDLKPPRRGVQRGPPKMQRRRSVGSMSSGGSSSVSSALQPDFGPDPDRSSCSPELTEDDSGYSS